MNGAQIANRLLTLLLFAGASVWVWSDGTADLESAMAEPGKHHIVIPVDSPDQQTICRLRWLPVNSWGQCYW